ncbi:MAG: DeoR/GlpR family DNA-binding transcription regulator [Bifidobacteriaceae bacterium]|jgi:DeoR/GlpR family transcriptional regulator of sugar metabolism|nr:DeoR/GlpR family DNA-binding transcription regulator [Bifidobacteriaceae bacterium]
MKLRDTVVTVLSVTRQAAILKTVRHNGEVSVTGLAQELGVSASTIRRDLDALSQRGELRRVRGGSVVEADPVPFDEVARVGGADREAVARRAAQLVPDGAVVVLDIGTTTARLAHHLRGRAITVITASLAAVRELETQDSPEVVVLGGVLRRTYHSLVGSLTTDALSLLRADMCFMSMSGIGPDGMVMDDTGMEVPVKRAMLAAADRRVALATRSKFPGTGMVAVARLGAGDALVTNAESDRAALDSLRQAGVEVILA